MSRSGGGAGSIDGDANRRPQKSTIENFATVGFAGPPVQWGVEYNNLARGARARCVLSALTPAVGRARARPASRSPGSPLSGPCSGLSALRGTSNLRKAVLIPIWISAARRVSRHSGGPRARRGARCGFKRGASRV
eukprot:scaffold9148_cov59-Phaeocystis_antarctica.AAC.1